MNESSNEAVVGHFYFKRLDNGEVVDIKQGLESEKEILKTY